MSAAWVPPRVVCEHSHGKNSQHNFSYFGPSDTEVPPTESKVFPGVCPEDTKEEYHQSYSWLPYRGYCYLFVTDEIEWANAAGSCVRHGKKSLRGIKKKKKKRIWVKMKLLWIFLFKVAFWPVLRIQLNKRSFKAMWSYFMAATALSGSACTKRI